MGSLLHATQCLNTGVSGVWCCIPINRGGKCSPSLIGMQHRNPNLYSIPPFAPVYLSHWLFSTKYKGNHLLRAHFLICVYHTVWISYHNGPDQWQKPFSLTLSLSLSLLSSVCCMRWCLVQYCPPPMLVSPGVPRMLLFDGGCLCYSQAFLISLFSSHAGAWRTTTQWDCERKAKTYTHTHTHTRDRKSVV